ncbi:MAG: hypothetical protein IKW00_01560 [Clostridia bacterium]|nr:hypothetical protein [Clostridia bacterium]
MTKLLSLVLVLCMVLGMVPAFASEEALPTYTYKAATTALGNNWNPHSWETNADDSILGYLSSPFCTMQILDSENGVYQWVYEMATSITDVTAENKADLTKYAVTLSEGETLETADNGYVFEIALNPNAKWQDGTPINADSYVASMKYLLDPEMKNYRANLYYSGESAVAGGLAYYNSGSDIYTPVVPAYGAEDTPDYSFDLAANDAYLHLTSGTTFTSSYTIKDLLDMGYIASTDVYNALAAQANAVGYIKVTEENKAQVLTVLDEFCAAFGLTIYADEAKTAANEEYLKEFLFYISGQGEVVDFETVGLYKVDDYTIRYVTAAKQDINYFRTSCTSTWLIHEDTYVKGFDTTGTLKTTDYGTSIETTMSYGPYKIESLQADKQIVFVQNENWHGYTKAENGALESITPYLVDGEQQPRYITNRVVIDVMNEQAMKQAFLKGELTEWTPQADEMPVYATSDQMYKVDETYTMSFFFNTGVAALKEMDNSKGNQNSVVLSNLSFRKAFSRAIDRAEYVTATEGYKPAFALMNNLYFYDVYNDPTSSYRNSEPAMQAVCNLYDVKWGEGTPYATLRDAYLSINGYNLTEAKELMAKAFTELTEAGLYTAGAPIHIRIGWAKGGLTSADNKQCELMAKYLNAAIEGTGFGAITLEPIGNISDRYGDVPKGEYAIGYGAWGGAAFYPFRNMQVYCDTDQYEINEAGCWDPAVETLTLTVNGEEVTMTWKEWSGALIGTGRFTDADNYTKLQITAAMEEEYLKKVYRIPLAGTTLPSLLSYQVNYYTEDYNIMYGFGGLELMTYNFNDAEWADYVASEGGVLSYE